jgi:hypothetical protein
MPWVRNVYDKNHGRYNVMYPSLRQFSRRVYGLRSRSGCCVEKEIPKLLPGIELRPFHKQPYVVQLYKGKRKVVPVLNYEPRQEGELASGDISPCIL